MFQKPLRKRKKRREEKAKFLFRCGFSIFFFSLYLFWCFKQNTCFPDCVSRQLVSCEITKKLYFWVQWFIIFSFFALFCREQVLYRWILILALCVYVFDCQSYYTIHYIFTVLYISLLVVSVLLCNKWWCLLLFIPALIGLVSKNLCCAEISFLCIIVWLL